MPLPLRHGRARGACGPRGIMSGSRRPPCRLTAYCQSRANAGQTVRSPQAQDHNRGEKRWHASERDHPRHREPFPISPRIRQDPQGQRSRSAPLQSVPLSSGGTPLCRDSDTQTLHRDFLCSLFSAASDSRGLTSLPGHPLIYADKLGTESHEPGKRTDPGWYILHCIDEESSFTGDQERGRSKRILPK